MWKSFNTIPNDIENFKETMKQFLQHHVFVAEQTTADFPAFMIIFDNMIILFPV